MTITETRDYNSKLGFVSRCGKIACEFILEIACVEKGCHFFQRTGHGDGYESRASIPTADANLGHRFRIFYEEFSPLHRQHGQRRFITINLGSVISSIAYLKPSRPSPESLMPPCGM